MGDAQALIKNVHIAVQPATGVVILFSFTYGPTVYGNQGPQGVERNKIGKHVGGRQQGSLEKYGRA